ncbi:ABC transporter substrate-binding protein [Herbaspirillum rubrisubalbicans]|uniref:ABC transporter substrate-binding protein n=2 Tax=Herbaspirillum rubrisubalbicans TaxID=80842 RepID=A0ABX9C2A9_9BURK|nr:extracellular solute-binding protein [Herbaspirillum rubrisubalbicans]QJQ02249.1 ABC transporter substrate-binding protein [Herbaspirillum rubrisubalbicans Os34]RAM64599.1 ABC transporter substrate-binding protein [Herbaspirillum rubrisubalbicans]RAN49953.1 ABC transporter substrate-binding protein [Herbaspirillum rubrisubalbicans]
MSKLTRREFLVTSAAAAAASSLGANAFAAGPGVAGADSIKYPIEAGATLRVLRWKRFVQGDEDLWNANVKKFTELTGIPVRTDSEGWEDVRPKSAVAANVGSGPDIVLGWFDDPQQYPTKLIDMTDLADSLGKRYGGWYDVCRKYGTKDGKWIALPLGVIGNALVYRESQIKAAGFDAIPKDTAGFLKLCQALKAKDTPVGFALGKAVGDANNWAHWLLWSHGGKLVNKQGQVVINSPETRAALEYAKQLYATFVPGTLSWQDPSNNKAYLDGQISLTANGISVYYAAKNSQDPKLQEIGRDTQHAHFPIGPVGKPSELMQITQMMVFKHTKYPNAAKAFVQFMFEPDQYNPWMKASIGYVSQSLKAYEKNPVWTDDPKATVYRDSASLMLDHGHEGPLGQASAACMADYVVVDMVAEAASGAKTVQQAIDRAAERAKRYYKA